MLIACHRCHRQYDVGTMKPGQRIRCHCGSLNEVPEPRSREAPMQNCSNCGGDVQPGTKFCGYCGCQVSIQDRGWGETCPECFARMVKGAKFCNGCGTAIKPRVVKKHTRRKGCPRCDGPLVDCEIPGGVFTECTGCGGVWLEEQAFEELTQKQEEQTAVASYFSTPQRQEKAKTRRFESNVKYISCPVCDQVMNRRNFAKCSGVVIDSCKGHGYWFDAHELEAILEFVAGGGLEKARKRSIADSKRQEKLARDRARSASAAMAQDRAFGGGLGYGHTRGAGTFIDVVLTFLRSF